MVIFVCRVPWPGLELAQMTVGEGGWLGRREGKEAGLLGASAVP